MQQTLVARTLLGGLAGILAIAGWAALAFGVLEGMFGGSPSLLWLVLGITFFFSGPTIVGFMNRARWQRVVLTGVIAPIVAVLITGGLALVFTFIEVVVGPIPFDRAPMLVTVYVAAFIGIAELLTSGPTEVEMRRVLANIGLALLIVIVLEAIRIVTGLVFSSGEPSGWGVWLTIAVYAFLIGANNILFDAGLDRPGQRSSYWLVTIVGLNVLALIIVLVADLILLG